MKMVKNFKFFSENYPKIKSITDLIERWEPTGLLDDVELPELVAHILETSLQFILEERSETPDDINSCIFPILKRLYNNKRRYYFDEEIKNMVDRIIERLTYHLITHRNPDLYFYVNIDHEAEICFMIVEELKWEE